MTAERIRLPSINELTSNSPDMNRLPGLKDIRPTQASPLEAGQSPPTFNYQSKSSNYVFGANINSNVQKLPSPTLPYYEQPQAQHQVQYYSYQMALPPLAHQGYYQAPYYYGHPQSYKGTAVTTAASAHKYAPEVINKPTNECHRCGTTETPEWRRGPNGVRTLCNACGLFHAKLVKRKGAALAAEEVLNNKVCKGKNGRRIAIKKTVQERLQSQARGNVPVMVSTLPPPIVNQNYSPMPLIRH